MQPNDMLVEAEDPGSLAASDDQQELPSLQPLPEEAIQFDWHNKWLKGNWKSDAGEEYSHMLRNLDRYCQKFGFARYPKKTHPQLIYSQPESTFMEHADGTIYFVEGDSIGSEFGFPRVSMKKRYRWKKMNFTTDLPKKRPEVTYIVASAVKCQRFFPNSKNEGPLFRMHAVMLYRSEQTANQSSAQEQQPTPRYVLCHIRKLDASYKATEKKQKPEPVQDTNTPPSNSLTSELESKSEANLSTSLLEITPPGAVLSTFFRDGIDYFRLFRHLHNLQGSGKDPD